MQQEQLELRAAPAANAATAASVSALAVLTDDSPSLFRDGFYSPYLTAHSSSSTDATPGLPWKSVREVIAMADNALKAKQRAAERLQRQLAAVRKQGAGGDKQLLQRAQRAEVDCGSLVDELQQLMHAKAHVAQQRADLDRANSLLMAERELLCEQLQVSPDNVNLCQAVSKVLAAARKAKALDTQLRLLAKCQRELLLQLEAQRESTARAERAARQWQAEKQLYVQLLAEHGIQPPELPEQLQQHPGPAAASSPIPGAAAAESAAAGSGSSGLASSGSLTSSSAALMAQLLLMRSQSSGSSGCVGVEQCVGSPQAHLPPGTPPVDDLPPALAQGTPPMSVCHMATATTACSSSDAGGALMPMRRSHSLDSCLNSLPCLLEQLALGQLCGSEEDCEGGESDSCWNLDAMSADDLDHHQQQQQQQPQPCSSSAACGAAAGVGAVAAGSTGASCSQAAAAAGAAAKEAVQQQQQMHQHHHLQPVMEVAEECC